MMIAVESCQKLLTVAKNCQNAKYCQTLPMVAKNCKKLSIFPPRFGLELGFTSSLKYENHCFLCSPINPAFIAVRKEAGRGIAVQQ